ncbi:MAG: thiamine diphosphokinase [Notoacmeibacter sp.]
MSFNPFTILLGGACTPTPRLLAQVAGTRAIAADGGMAHAKILSLKPELWVGDFDSTPADLALEFSAVPRLQFDAAKAKSDGELAIEAAIARNANALILVGALGGARSDHQMMILTNAMALAEQGLPVLLTSGQEEATCVLPGEIRVDLPESTVFSVIGLTDLTGLSLSHVRWPLSNHDVPFGSTLTLSNEALGGPVMLSLRAGKAVMFSNLGSSL